MSPDPILEVRDIRKRYGYVEALRGVDFGLRPARSSAWSATTGAGKSTLVKVISGAIAPDEGEILSTASTSRSTTPGRRWAGSRRCIDLC